jgi:hypothetical protein
MAAQAKGALSEAARAYPIPIALALVAWVPIDPLRGILFSFHGGLGWVLLALAFPWLIVRIVQLLFVGPTELRSQRRLRALAVGLGYIPLSVVCAYSLLSALNPPFRETLPNVLRWFYIPVSFIGGVW